MASGDPTHPHDHLFNACPHGTAGTDVIAGAVAGADKVAEHREIAGSLEVAGAHTIAEDHGIAGAQRVDATGWPLLGLDNATRDLIGGDPPGAAPISASRALPKAPTDGRYWRSTPRTTAPRLGRAPHRPSWSAASGPSLASAGPARPHNAHTCVRGSP